MAEKIKTFIEFKETDALNVIHSEKWLPSPQVNVNLLLAHPRRYLYESLMADVVNAVALLTLQI
jgi:hypothetical protein